MQTLMTKGKLLDKKGFLIEKGYATSLVREYDRKAVKANKRLRLKEWDYYYIGDKNYGLALTISDIGYASLVSVSVLDFKKAEFTTMSDIGLFPHGKYNFPSSYEVGDIKYKSKKLEMNFLNDGNKRILTCDSYGMEKVVKAEITLFNSPRDAMVIATPFKDKPKAFYYNAKVNNLSVSGYFSVDGNRYDFDKYTAQGTLDWGRGVWTYKNTWYWGSLSCISSGHKFGFNIGYGFGDTSAASENMVFVDGIAHKLDQVTFHIPKDENGKEEYLKEWLFTSNDNRFTMKFKPILNRSDLTDLKIIVSDQNQVFGLFSGKVILDDGSTFEIKDELGFAEKVANKW